MVRKIAVFMGALVLLVVLIAYGGVRYYGHQQLLEHLNRAMAKDAALAETVLKIESDSSHVTYGELFDLCDHSIKEREDLIIELRELQPGIRPEIRDQLIAHLNQENDFVRVKREYYRKSLDLSNAEDEVKNASEEHVYDSETWENRLSDAKRRSKQRALELEEAVSGFTAAYGTVMEDEKKLIPKANASGISLRPVFSRYEKSNKEIANKSLQFAVLLYSKY
jgi:hypothetical protein